MIKISYNISILIGVAIGVAIGVVLTLGLGLFLNLIAKENKNNHQLIPVGGKVPININEDGFNDHTVVSVKITLLHYLGSPVTIYYGGDCKDLDTIKTILPNRTRYHSPPLSHHQEFNYYDDTPLYVLSNTNITYSIAANTNLSDSGCVVLYLFNTNTSFHKFLISQNAKVNNYYTKSSCIQEGTQKTPKNAHNTTFHITESTFIYAGLAVTGVNTTVEGNVSVQLMQYHPTKFSSVNLTNTKRSEHIQVCHQEHLEHDLCLTLEEHIHRHCILAESSKLANITTIVEEIQYSQKTESATIYIVIIIILFLISLVCVMVILCGCHVMC